MWNLNFFQIKNLKILIVINVLFSRAPSPLPESFRVLKWCGYLESSLPAHFDSKKHVILDFSIRFFTFKNPLIMMNFKKSSMEMKLSGCELLKEVPDLSGAPNLKN
ncbi:hypothetical protein GLYMA_02G107250v4 [Glycine max]|nr:hypothetical protein GLYMA_02G107250v4 [Glycine max]KAH1059742.1 hypothetical protein GYH30_003644 [Glycine max]